MKKFFNAGYKLMSFDTETQLISELNDRTNDRVDYVFMVTEDGDFVSGTQSIPVKADEIVAVLYGNDDRDDRKVAIYGSKEHVAHMLEYIEIRKKRDAEQELHHKCSNSEDCCKKSSYC